MEEEALGELRDETSPQGHINERDCPSLTPGGKVFCESGPRGPGRSTCGVSRAHGAASLVHPVILGF